MHWSYAETGAFAFTNLLRSLRHAAMVYVVLYPSWHTAPLLLIAGFLSSFFCERFDFATYASAHIRREAERLKMQGAVK